jgi:DNA-binding response OmpR family regulator
MRRTTGRSGLEAICSLAPDLVILDWEMPGLNGAEFMRQVRSPRDFPYPDLPVIMLTGYGERSRVVEAVRLGVNEFLLKPVSTQALLARIAAVLTKPRRMVQKGRLLRPRAASAFDLQAGSRSRRDLYDRLIVVARGSAPGYRIFGGDDASRIAH